MEFHRSVILRLAPFALTAGMVLFGCSQSAFQDEVQSKIPPLALTETECQSNFLPEALPLGRTLSREETKTALASALNLEVIAQGFLEAAAGSEITPLNVPAYLEFRACDRTNHRENPSFFNEWWAHSLELTPTPDCPITLHQTASPAAIGPQALDSILLHYALGGNLEFSTSSRFFQNLTAIERLSWSGEIEKRTLESNPSFRTQETRAKIIFTDETPMGLGTIGYERHDQLCQLSVRPLPVGRTSATYIVPSGGEEFRLTIERSLTGYSKSGISSFHIQGREIPLVDLGTLISELVTEGRLKGVFTSFR